MQNSWKSSSPREISFKKTFLLQYQHIKNIFFNENVYIVPCNTVLYMYKAQCCGAGGAEIILGPGAWAENKF